LLKYSEEIVMSDVLGRREFLAAGVGLAVGAVGLAGCQSGMTGGISSKAAYRNGFAAEPLDVVRVGIIGLGNRGGGHVRRLLKLDNVEVRAVCDILEDKVAKAQEVAEEAGQMKPEGYSQGDYDYKRMCQRDDLDLVVIATPWRWHAVMCVDAMNMGKHAAVEVPAVVTIEECWQIVDTAEKTGKHCVILENCCYDRVELLVMNMVRQNVLGELLHAECGYLHNLRRHKLGNNYQGQWRLQHSIKRNGDLYPTHGLGPVAQCMNINRGGQFDYLVSVASKARGLNLLAAKKFGPDSELAKQKYALGDVVTTTIKTVSGETIVVTHDTNSPRPYSRGILVQGTKGLVRKYPKPVVHIEGISKGHSWQDINEYYKEYDHPMWTRLQEKAKDGGHGGIDYIMTYRLIECLRKGEPMDMDVYDAAAWSVVSELSEQSIASGSKPVKFPDFTRGAWKSREPLAIIGA
jgi:predicted dehydrogenase